MEGASRTRLVALAVLLVLAPVASFTGSTRRAAEGLREIGVSLTLATLVVHLLPGILGLLSREAVLMTTALLGGSDGGIRDGHRSA